MSRRSNAPTTLTDSRPVVRRHPERSQVVGLSTRDPTAAADPSRPDGPSLDATADVALSADAQAYSLTGKIGSPPERLPATFGSVLRPLPPCLQ
jgi:hypothetical protein